MNKPKDPCEVCPFVRQCIADAENKHWCFVRILTLEAWDRFEQHRKQELDESFRSLGCARDDRDGGGAE